MYITLHASKLRQPVSIALNIISYQNIIEIICSQNWNVHMFLLLSSLLPLLQYITHQEPPLSADWCHIAHNYWVHSYTPSQEAESSLSGTQEITRQLYGRTRMENWMEYVVIYIIYIIWKWNTPLHRHWGTIMTTPMPVEQPWWIWVKSINI